MDYTSPYITTASGQEFFYGEPSCGLSVPDIAWHLARVNRFGGAVREPYSVAQHSDFVALMLRRWGCDPLTQQYGRFHDAHEAVFGDFPTPAQRFVMRLNGGRDIIGEAKAVIDAQVMPAIGLPWPAQPGIWALVKRADKVAFAIEAAQLFNERPDYLDGWIRENGVGEYLFEHKIEVLDCVTAEGVFLEGHALEQAWLNRAA